MKTLPSSGHLLAPKEKIVHKEVWGLKGAAARMKLKKLFTKTTASSSRKQEIVNCFERFQFLMLQQPTQKLKPKGRRFTLDDKIFALSFYKRSGKCYQFLSKIFTLPSHRTITNVLIEIPFGCGTNNLIFEHVKGIVAQMKTLNKTCVLLFDEVALEYGLEYNQNHRKDLLIDHALVFIARGIYLIGTAKIVSQYDFPHLIKGVCNSLLNKNLHFTIDGVEKV